VKKDPRVYLAHILECAQKIERYTKGGEKEFHNDTMKKLIVSPQTVFPSFSIYPASHPAPVLAAEFLPCF